MTQSTHPVLIAGQPKENIIFLHLGPGALKAVLTALHRSPFHRFRDFIEVEHIEDLKALLFRNRPQLLTLNLFAGIDSINELVAEFQEVNPQLVVVLTTVLHVNKTHMFDQVIHKDSERWMPQFVDAMQDFLSGKMRRRVVPHLEELISV